MPNEPTPIAPAPTRYRVSDPLLDTVKKCELLNGYLVLDEQKKLYIAADSATGEWVLADEPSGVLLTLEVFSAMRASQANGDGNLYQANPRRMRAVLLDPSLEEGVPSETLLREIPL
jgi:hypothetical protein